MSRADYSRIACGHIAAARHQLGMDRGDFARYIRDLTGWDVLPESVEAWEDDVTPPGDVVLACMGATQGMRRPSALPGCSAGRSCRPPFALAEGARRAVGDQLQVHPRRGSADCHADVAWVTAEDESRIRAVNHARGSRWPGPARRSATRSRPGLPAAIWSASGRTRPTSGTAAACSWPSSPASASCRATTPESARTSRSRRASGSGSGSSRTPASRGSRCGVGHGLYDLVMSHSQPARAADLGRRGGDA